MPVNINDTPAKDLGWYFKKGGLYQELLKLPKPKERFSYDWKDENGKDYDTTAPTVYEPVQYSIPCYLVADDIADLQIKRREILSVISDPEGFLLVSETLTMSFRLRYIDNPSFRTLVPVWIKGKLYCEFTLVLENNFEEGLPVYDYKYLVDNSGRYIVINGDKKIMVKTSY